MLGGPRRALRLADLPEVQGMFVANSTVITAVHQVDNLVLTGDAHLMRKVLDRFQHMPWDPI